MLIWCNFNVSEKPCENQEAVFIYVIGPNQALIIFFKHWRHNSDNKFLKENEILTRKL